MATIEKLPFGDNAERQRLFELDMFLATFDDEYIHPYTRKSIEELDLVLNDLEKQYSHAIKFKKSVKEVMDHIKLVEAIIEKRGILSSDGERGIVIK
jgi:hypothetical protein